MLVSNLLVNNYPSVNLNDPISFALQMMDDYEITQITIANDDKYIGVINKDDLLDADEEATIASLHIKFIKLFVDSNDHFSAALKLAVQHHLTLVPVINEQSELLGVVAMPELLNALFKFIGGEEPGAIIVIEMDKRDYSFGEISRLVETNDAYITQLNTSVDSTTGLLQLTLKINKFEISDIIATFQRYEYVVKYYFGEESYANQLKDNYDLLMTYLRI
jgi:acetoin utilization protein AcuB